MKKILALVLVLVLCLGALASCNPKQTIGNIKDKITGIFHKENEELNNAAKFVFNMYKNEPEQTTASYTLAATAYVNGVKYTVTWSVDTDLISIVPVEGDETLVTVVIPELSADREIPYVLTATISNAEGESVVKTFNRVVPKLQVNTWDEYMAAVKDDVVIIEGYAVAVQGKSAGNKYNAMYVYDLSGLGGYYIYSTKPLEDGTEYDPIANGVKDGVRVRVIGTKDIYNGVHEVKNAEITIVDSTVANVTPYDLTEDFGKATSASSDILTSKLGMLVTIKGVEITTQDAAAKYYKFMYNGIETYVRISSSDCPAVVSSTDRNKIISEHAAHQGYTANVTGVVVLYNGLAYLLPVSATPFEYLEAVERTPEEKVAFTKTGLTLTDHVKNNIEITVPTVSNLYKEDVTITWSSDNNCIKVENGKLVVTLPKGGEALVTVTATITCGDVSDNKIFTVRVDKAPTLVPQVVTNPEVGVPYKYYLVQKTNNNQQLYFEGSLYNSYYLQTTEKVNEAMDVYLETVEGVDGAYRLYFMDGSVKTYIVITERDGANVGKANVGMVPGRTPEDFYTWNANYSVLIYTNPVTENSFYIGTYNNFTTFSASNTSYLGGSSNFAAQFVTLVDVDNVSAEDKVAEEKAALELVGEVEYDTVITLPTAVLYDTDVIITWASNNACAVVSADGKTLTITTGRYAQTVTVTATIKCENVTETKDFVIEVAEKNYVEIAPVATPTTGVAYKVYLENVTLGKKLYFVGTMTGYYLTTSESIGLGVDVYVESVEGTEGGYNLYFLVDGVKNYIVTTQRSDKPTSGNVTITTDAPTTYYTWDETVGTYVVTVEDGNAFFLGAYNTNVNIGASNLSYITGDSAANLGTTNFVLKFATLQCSHYYPADCAEYCEFCGVGRETNASHTHDNACDKVCNVCGETRVTNHVDEDGNEVCDICELDFSLKTPEEIVNALYELQAGETLRGGKLYTLTGVITNIDTAYNPEYGNITVTIVVNGMTDKPIQCYRLKGTGAEILIVGDTVTVTGKLKRYNSTYEFDSGCTINSFVTAEAEPAEKLDHEAALIGFETNFVADANVNVPVKGVRYSDVSIAWTSDSPYVIVTGNGKVISVTLQRYAQNVTVTATLTVGETTKVLTYDVTLAERVYLVNTPVATPTTGVAYKVYLENVTLGKNLYLAGTMTGYYLATSESIGLGVDVYVESAEGTEGGYNLYFLVDGVKNYIVTTQRSDKPTSGNVTITTDAPTTYYTWDETVGTYVVTAEDGNAFFLGAYNTNVNIGASNLSYITGDNAGNLGTTNFVLKFATVVCSHYYPTDCAYTCEFCGISRDYTTADHTYATACSTKCSACNEVRTEGLVHEYEYGCSTVCKVCEQTTRTEGLTHTYLYECSVKCEYCETTRTAKDHTDANPYDGKCDYCGCNVAPFELGAPLVMFANSANSKMYVTGVVSNGYLVADANLYDAVYVYIEAANEDESAYRLYTLNGETKNYIEITAEGTVAIVTEATDSYTFDWALMAFVSTTYNSYLGSAYTAENGFLAIGAFAADSAVAPAKMAAETITATPAETLDALYALEAGESLDGTYTLTGVVIAIDTPYSEQYKNITVTIVVNADTTKPVQCYRLKGEGVADIEVGDYITVTGTLKRYKNTYEFDAPTLVSCANVYEAVESVLALDNGFALEGLYTVKGAVEIDEENNAYVKVGNTLVAINNIEGAGTLVLTAGATIELRGVLMNNGGVCSFGECVLLAYTTDGNTGDTPSVDL